MRNRIVGPLLALSLMCPVAAVAAVRPADVAPNLSFALGAPATTNNDDSCDIGVYPAATLLLPYFEVDIGPGQTTATNFTITNVTRLPQIAHVTLWTDWSFPVLDFNIFLTGYDVQSINLWQVLVQHIVAPGGPGTSSTNAAKSPRPTTGQPGAIPSANNANPNLVPAASSASGPCADLPGLLPPNLMNAVVTALTTGLYNPGVEGVGCNNTRVGGTHANAVGYITIDVAANCSVNLPDGDVYFATEILFDNVLIGDYAQVSTANNFAQLNPMVHIRAIPEGGPAGSVVATNLPYTFYDRYTSVVAETRDRRQPLPATFAARYIQGGVAGFQTDFKIWREGLTFGTQSCFEASSNADLPIVQITRFDERENSFGFSGGTVCSPCGPDDGPSLPETSRTNTTNQAVYPPLTSGDVGGWMYLNLNNFGSLGYSASRAGFDAGVSAIRASQNWVIVSMFADGRFSGDFDAAMLGNGCSPAVGVTSTPGNPINPSQNVTP